MKICYAREEFPTTCSSSVFLAGPTPRSKDVQSWRPEALEVLEGLGVDVVYVPEHREGKYTTSYEHQIEWEEKALNRADVILFWVPRDLADMPAFTTNVEFGAWMRSGKVVYGRPVGAPKTQYLDHYAKKYGFHVVFSLEDACEIAVNKIERWSQRAPSSDRSNGECCVPLNIWSTPQFQSWYQNLLLAGNRLDGFRVLWEFLPRSSPSVFCWAAHADIWIGKENRSKTNEFVIGRPDIFCVALLHEGEIVLVREFRSPVSNADGYVYELPGGSSKTDQSALSTARDELREETGLDIPEIRFQPLKTRQIAATILSHRATLYRVDLTEMELIQVKKAALEKSYFGEAGDSEVTWPETVQVEQVFGLPFDWSMLGMIFEATRGR